MSNVLEQLESSLQQVEDQLLAEFERIRKTLSAEPYSSIDAGIKDTLNQTVMSLWHDLEHSGDRNNLTLRTERHETMSIRMIVLKKLLDARIPTAFLAEAQEEIEKSRRAVRTTSKSARKTSGVQETIDEPAGFFESIMQFFRGKPVPDSRVPVEDEESEQESIGVYLDSVYAASRHLAALAGRFQTVGDDKDMMNAAASGRAVFESRELSAGALEALEGGAAEAKAQSPEEIRRKLEQSERQSGGTSTFESRELSSTTPGPVSRENVAKTPDAIRKKLEDAGPRTGGTSTFESRELSATLPPMASNSVRPVAEKKPPRKQDVAQTPEEIRRKLEARQGDSGATGRASFGSKDIKPAGPQDVPKPRKPKEEPVKRPSGKAVFESKDLSSPDKK
jgi:hypothetical protein